MGVFDLFHIGHLRLIERAKTECDFLRVGLLSDEQVIHFKQHASVIPLEERMAIVAAIRYVDEVVAINGSPSRIEEWHRRPFDCFVSGDDYEGDPYWEWVQQKYEKQ